jgi:ATP-binding cassette subfamily B protein
VNEITMQDTTAEFVANSSLHTDHSSPGRFIWSHIRRHPWVGTGMILGAFSNAALASVLPYLIGEAFNAIVDSKDMQRVGYLSLVIIVSQVIRGGLQLMRNFSSETFAQRVERDVRDELYGSLLGKSMAYHDLQPVGEIMARVANDVREMNYFMSPGLNMVVGSGMFLLMPLIASPMIHPALILTPALFIPIYAFVQYRYVRSLHRVAQDVRARFGRMNARLAETLDGIEVVKGTAQEEQESARLSKLIDDVRDRFIDQGRIEARYFAILLFGIAVVGAFLHAAILYRANAIDIGDAISFMGQISLFDFPVFTSSFSLARLASGYASAERILNVITAKTDLDQNEAGARPDMKGSLIFDQVDFSFMPGSLVLSDISFSIEPGKTVAIVGQTGSGKSALTKLINRTYDVDTGRVLVDGIDVRDWHLAALRSQISIIEQEIFLFSRSIADNIRFGCPTADQQAVEEAAKKAQAHDFIMSFPEGYETVIGQRGVTLSGGQRQRLAIARAFLTDPRILILDDSTSAIDSATEDRIQKAIWAAARGRTTILITHRLSQIRWADHIIVMRKGRIVAQGRHEDLIQQSNAYRRIFARYEGAEDEPPVDSPASPPDEAV